MWSWPKAVGGKGATAKEIFNPKRVASDAKAKTIKLQMSEGLSLFPVLQHWVRQTVVPSGSHAEATEAMLALLDFIELLYYQARVEVTPAELTAASTRFLRLAKQALGTEWMIPKAHFQLHFGKRLEGLGFLRSAIPLERKHKTLMQYADAIKDTRSGVYDGSVLREVLNRQLAHLESAEWLDLDEGLVRP